MAFADTFEEVLQLIAETGDRCIVVSERHEPYVIMDIRQYRSLLKAAAGRERLAGLSEHELLDRINQEIAEWRDLREDALSDYDLAQFRVGSQARKRAAAPTQPVNKPSEPSVEPSIELPVVSEDSKGEYQLEPLG